MSTKHSMAWGVAPIFLRIALAVVFIWAGLSKVMGTMEVDPESAATLANMGVLKPPTGGASSPTPTGPTKPLPPPTDVNGEPSEKPTDQGGRVDAGARIILASQPANETSSPPTTGTPAPAATPAPTGLGYTAKDFPEKTKVKGVYMLALMLRNAGEPTASPQNPSAKAIWPPALAGGRLPVIVAYLVVVAELGGGILVLIGLCTRLASVALAGVMVGAIWLAQIGPALQKGDTFLGFLPNYPAFAMEWSDLFFQFTLLCAALSLLFSGPGYFALDHALFGRRRGSEDHDDE